MYEPTPPPPRRIAQETYELRYPRVDVFAHPDVKGPTVAELTQDDEFQVIGAGVITGPEYKFYRVRLRNGVEGFVFEGNLRGPPPTPAANENSDLQVERLPLTPTMRAQLMAYEEFGRWLLILGLPIAASCFLLTLATSAGMRWEIVALVAGLVALVVVPAWRRDPQMRVTPYRQDLRDGVYCRATGRITVEEERQGEDTISRLWVGEQRLSCGWDFDRLRDRPGAATTGSRFWGNRLLIARATVIYLPAAGEVLEVRSEAGELLYQHPVLSAFPLSPDRAGRSGRE